VPFDRAFGDHQPVGDLAIRQAAFDQRHDLALATSQRVRAPKQTLGGWVRQPAWCWPAGADWWIRKGLTMACSGGMARPAAHAAPQASSPIAPRATSSSRSSLACRDGELGSPIRSRIARAAPSRRTTRSGCDAAARLAKPSSLWASPRSSPSSCHSERLSARTVRRCRVVGPGPGSRHRGRRARWRCPRLPTCRPRARLSSWQGARPAKSPS
jgi:hypothetical protein